MYVNPFAPRLVASPEIFSVHTRTFKVKKFDDSL